MLDSETATNIQSGFVRQRRNLLVVSLVLLAFQATGATISTINAFGNVVNLKSPTSVIIPLWVAWGYFLARYYQYLRDLGDRGVLAKYVAHLHDLVGRAAIKQLPKYYDARTLTSYPHPSAPAFTDTRTEVTQKLKRMWIVRVRGYVHIRDTDSQGSWGTNVEQSILLPNTSLLPLRVRAVIWVVLHTRLATEYGLPFVVATLPPLRLLVT